MHERAPFHIKALHGVTGSVGNLVFVAFELFVIFFYQRVVGLDGRLVGLAVLISLLVDALSDPVIGDWSDRLRARFGRRHTMMFGSVLPMGLFFFLLFAPPAGLAQQGLFLWLLVMSVGARVTLTFFDAPAAAVTAEVAVRSADRAEMGIYRQVAGLLAYLGIIYLAFSVFFEATEAFPKGQENPAAYAPFGAVAALALMVFMTVAAAGTYRHIRRLENSLPPPSATGFDWMKTLRAWGDLIVRVRNTRALFFGLLLAGIMGSCFRSLNLHFGPYLWGLTTEQMESWQLAVPLGMLPAAVAARFVVTRTEPKYVYLAGYTVLLTAYVAPLFLTLAGWLPEFASGALGNILFGFQMAAGLGAGLLMICSLIMFSETTDEYRFARKASRTALILGLITFGSKLASGAGKMVSGWLLEWVDFPDIKSEAAVSPEVARNLALYAGVFCAAAGLAGLAVLSTFRLTRARHAEIVAGLRERDKALQAGSAPG